MTFNEFIEAVENDEIECPGLKHCSLEHRRALQVAYEAGLDEGYWVDWGKMDKRLDGKGAI